MKSKALYHLHGREAYGRLEQCIVFHRRRTRFAPGCTQRLPKELVSGYQA